MEFEYYLSLTRRAQAPSVRASIHAVNVIPHHMHLPRKRKRDGVELTPVENGHGGFVTGRRGEQAIMLTSLYPLRRIHV